MEDMSVFELFRRFFHPPGIRDPFFGGLTEDDDDEDDDSFFRHESGSGPEPPFWRGHSPPRDPFGFEDVFRDFNELFADFGSMIRDVPSLPGDESPTRGPGGSGTGSLRDFMLKYPDSHLPREQPSPALGHRQGPHHPRWQDDDSSTILPGGSKEDKILDSEVSSRGLDSILRPSDPAPSSYFRSVSVSRVMRPDGTLEERRTVKDGDGNTTTTVTVTRGDQAIIADPSRGALIDEKDSALVSPRSAPDLFNSQTILSHILQRWFSNR